jgi:hypothetical protein
MVSVAPRSVGTSASKLNDLTSRIIATLTELSEDYVLTILNSEGTVIEQAADTDFANRLQDALPMMSEMYSAARRQALGVDGAIDDILGELSKRIPFE